MKLFIRPEHFQTVHYYFFSLGMFSLTIAFMFPLDSVFSFIFISFYSLHSAIAWYMSWFLHRRVKAIYIIQNTKYIANHAVLTVVAGGLAVAFYYIFSADFEAMMTSIITINFFVIFLGFIWYAMGAMRIVEKFVEWQEERKLQIGRDMVLRFRRRRMIDLLDEETIKSYRWGADSSIDQAFMDIKVKSENGEEFGDEVKKVELGLSEMKIGELERKVQNLETGDVSPSDMELIKTYREAIKTHRKRMMDYEKRFYERFKNPSEGNVQHP
jgi:hypothetical protein